MLEKKEFDDFLGDIDNLSKHIDKIKGLEGQVYAEQQAYAKEYEKKLKQIKNLRPELDTPESRQRYQELMAKIKQLQKLRFTKQPLPLWLYLGSANFYLPDGHKVVYKVEYERTKTVGVAINITISLLQLLFNRPFLDALANFFTLYHYSTMTVREHILVINGSNIRPWWIVHHYLSILAAGTLLIWPSGPNYWAIRNVIIYFSIYLSGVQFLQYRQQVNRLYTLRALSRVDQMETTTDAENLHLSSSLVILLPFLFFGHGFQYYLSYRFYQLAVNSTEWQPYALGILFAAIASGNIIMTLLTVLRKARTKNRQSSAASAEGKKSN